MRHQVISDSILQGRESPGNVATITLNPGEVLNGPFRSEFLM